MHGKNDGLRRLSDSSSTCASQRRVKLHGPPPQPATGCRPEPQRIERPRIASWALPDTLPPMNLRQTRHMLYIVKGQNPDEHTSDTRSSKQSKPCSRTDHWRYECKKLLKEHIHDAIGPSMKTSMHTLTCKSAHKPAIPTK